MVLFPGLDGFREPEVRDGKAGEAGLRLGPAAGGSFVADFAPRAGGGAWKRGDGGRMVVGFDLAEKVDVLVPRDVLVRPGIDVEAAAAGSDEDGGIVLVGGENAVVVQLIRVLDHLEQRTVARGAVDFPGGVEDLV